MLTADQSGILPQHELEDLRAHMTAEQYAQEYAAAIVGAYFGRLLAEAEAEGRITQIDRLDQPDIRKMIERGQWTKKQTGHCRETSARPLYSSRT